MAKVHELAEQFKIPAEKLLNLLQEAGLSFTDMDEEISAQHKLAFAKFMTQRQMDKGKNNVAKASAGKNSKKSGVARRSEPKKNVKPKVNPQDLARQLARQKRVEQAEEMRQSEQEAYLRAQEEQQRVREEQERREQKEREEQQHRADELRAAQERREAETLRKKEEQLRQQLEEQRQHEENKHRQIEEDAEAKRNAEIELKKQQQRERESAKERAELERERELALQDVERHEDFEEEAQAWLKSSNKDRRSSQRNDRSGRRAVKGGEDRGKQAVRGSRQHRKNAKFEKPQAPITREVRLPETITVADLAQKMSVKAADLIKIMIKMGSMVTINQVLDQETAAVVVEEMGHHYVLLKENELEATVMAEASGDASSMASRAPVVTIMGHVDHGKTSLLDYIRRARVASGEAGGITQHIGAYRVSTDKGNITFLDTPGHAAFTAMRARGAQATDIVVLVVAADDGVMPQTIEAIQHAKAANVPLVVAVNKIDKPEADPERVKSELTQYGVVSEEWGGEHLFAYVSAKTGQGIDDLLDKILIEAEMLELQAPAEGPAKGVVIESRLDKGRGPVATVLVQSGLLTRGDIILAGMEYGKVRAMFNETEHSVNEAGPSVPVAVLGLSNAPIAGDEVIVVENEKKAREVALFRQGKFKEIKLARQQKANLENLFNRVDEEQAIQVNLLIKADVQGSVEALSDSLLELSTDKVEVKIIGSGVGGISESDAQLALASDATIIAFNVRAENNAKKIIEEEHLNLRYYSVIYEAIEDVRQAMIGKLAPQYREDIIGLAEVKQVFRVSGIGAVAGCMVEDGCLRRHNPIRVLRDNVVIFEGELESLRRFKDDVKEVRAGTECGLGVKNYNDIKIGDQIECYERVEVKQEL